MRPSIAHTVSPSSYRHSTLLLISFSVSFVHWIGIIIALIYGHVVSDRLPLAICARNGGTWKPEYRLYALFIPALVFSPIGLGIFG